MRRLLTLCGAMLAASNSALGGYVDSGLEAILEEATARETLSTLVFLSEQADTQGIALQMDAERASLRNRHRAVLLELQDVADRTQGDLIAELTAMQGRGGVESFRAFWVGNIIQVKATPDAIRQIAERDDVATVYFDYPIELDEPVSMSGDVSSPGNPTPEPGLVAIRAPEVWDLGFTGEGVLVSTLDTGVDGNHPALASRWAGVADPRYADHPEWAFFDPVTNQTFPFDSGSHGTHTMGTVCGGAPGDQIGVAPGALWIHCAVIDRVSIQQTVADAILSFQWILDPNEDPNTYWDVPAVCSNSWRLTTYHGYPPCDETFWTYLDAVEDAGIVILFSAGNEGPSAETIGRPPDRATTPYRTCAVGAIDAEDPNWTIASFSSRGPSYCTPDETMAIKPDIAAPGVDVRSSVPGNGYSQYSGTSMASPHVNGVVALMRQACPDLTPAVIKQILYDTAYDLGTAGEDNSYGWGNVDAYEAVLMAGDMCGPSPPEAFDAYYETARDTDINIELQAVDYDHEPDPPGQLTYIITELPVHGTLIDVNAGEIVTAPYSLVDYGNEVIYDPDWYFTGEDEFKFKANDGGDPPDGGDSNIATVTINVGVPVPLFAFNLDSDPGWSTEGQWAFGDPTGQGGSQWGNADPHNGATGSYVYGVNLNGDYNTDVGGPYYLTTSALDCSGLSNVALHFQRWLNSDYPPYVSQTLEVSNDGTDWTLLWSNPGNPMEDNAWHPYEFDISAVADDQETVYIRWGHEILDDGALPYSGWNIDDIEIWGLLPLECAADVNNDGVVDIDDLFAALDAWGDCDGCPEDVNKDGIVDIDDIFDILANWGPCP